MDKLEGYFLEKIMSGSWPIGAIIPPQRELVEVFGVNRSTVVSALDDLKADGILVGKGRGGTFVAENNFSVGTAGQAKWQQYIEEGIHIPNYKTIKMINENEVDSSILRLSSGEATPTIFSKEKMQYFPSEVSKEIESLGYEGPTGMLVLRKELNDLCTKEKLPVVEDDVYGELWIDEPPPVSLKSLDESGNVLHIGSVFKTLSPGLRIGWVVGPETVINRLADIKMQMDYGSSALSQLTVAKWFETGMYQDHLKEMRCHMKKVRDFVIELLERYYKDISVWVIPKGGFCMD